MRKSMVKLITLVSLSFSFIYNVHAEQIKNVYDVRKVVSKYSKKRLVNSLRMFVYKSKPNRFFGTQGHQNVREFLHATLKNYKIDDSITVSADTFQLNTEVGKALYQNDFDTKIAKSYGPETSEYKKWDGFKNYMQGVLSRNKDTPGVNYVWEKNGSSGKFLIITAHYDTVSHDPKTLKIHLNRKMPGADYNASGMGIALGLIDLLHDQKLNHGVRVVFLDAQSVGFLGAYDYAQKISKERENILGVINLEMLGHDSKHFDKTEKYKNFKVYARSSAKDEAAADVKLFNSFVQTTKKASVNIKFELEQNDFNNSDHFRFWEVGIPALTFSQNWEDDFNKKYQTENDFPETINQDTYYNAFKYLAHNTLGFLINL